LAARQRHLGSSSHSRASSRCSRRKLPLRCDTKRLLRPPGCNPRHPAESHRHEPRWRRLPTMPTLK
jgi:hypothetical protein